MNKKTLIIGGAIVLSLLVGFYIGSISAKRVLGGTTAATWTAANLVSNGTLDVAATATFSGATVLGSSGTAISNYKCATGTWDPGSIGTSTLLFTTSTDIALTGAVMGDTCKGSFSTTTTNGIKVECGITGTATGTLFLTNWSAAAINLGSGTAKVCYTH